MAWTDVQRVSTRWFLNGTSPSLAVSSTASGNLLVMAVMTDNLVGSTFGFPSGWATPVHITGSNSQLWISWYINNPGGITSVQITGVTNTTNTDVVFLEKHSDQASYVKDISALASGTGTALAASATLAHTAELVFGFGGVFTTNDTGTPTYDSGFTGHVIGHDGGSGTSYDEFIDSYSGTAGSITITPSISIAGKTWVAGIIGFDDAPTLTRSATQTFALYSTLSRAAAMAFALRRVSAAAMTFALSQALKRSAAQTFALYSTLTRSATMRFALKATVTRSAAMQIILGPRRKEALMTFALKVIATRRGAMTFALYETKRRAAMTFALFSRRARSAAMTFALEKNIRRARMAFCLAGVRMQAESLDVWTANEAIAEAKGGIDVVPGPREDA